MFGQIVNNYFNLLETKLLLFFMFTNSTLVLY